MGARYVATVEIDKTELLEAIDAALASSRGCRQALRRAETAYRRFRRRIEDGSSVSEALSEPGILEIRQELTDSLNALESARHKARIAIIGHGVSEGLSLGAMARMFGFSRQLIARLAKES